MTVAHPAAAFAVRSRAGWATGLIAVAGLAGAAGVALAAVAAHAVQNPALATAAQLLVLHAAAAVGIVAASRGSDRQRLYLAAASLMLAGAALFAGEISMMAMAGTRLFHFAAPTGGSAMIAGWLGLAVAAGLDLVRQR